MPLIAALAALVAAALLLARRGIGGGVLGAGAVVFLLGVAASRAASLSAVPGVPAAPVPPAVLQVNVALLLAGLLPALWAAVRALRADAGGPTLIAAALTVFAAALTAPVAIAAGPRAVGLALGLDLAGLLLGLVVVRLARRLGPATVARPVATGPGARTDRLLAAAAGTGAVLALAAPDARWLAAGALLALWSSHLLARRRGLARWPVGVALVSVLLLAAMWFVGVVTGGTGMALAELAGGPFSLAAQVYLAPGLALAGWAAMGLWPFHRPAPGVLLAPVGAALLGRFAVPAFADGFVHWETVLAPAAALAVWHGALTRRPGLVLAALCFLGLAARGHGVAVWLGLSLAAAAAEAVTRGVVPASARQATAAAAAALAAWGALGTVEAALRAEATWTLVAVVGTALAAPLLGAPAGAPAGARGER